MCRLLGYVAACDKVPADALADVLPAYTALSVHHCDGWGVAWRTPNGVRAVRQPVAAKDSAQYARVVERTRTDAAALHLRMATKGSTVGAENTHPFVRDGLAFTHNGFVGPIRQLEPFVDPGLRPQGSTDSEWYFLAVLTAMRHGLSVAEALGETARRLLALDASFSANATLLTPDALYSVCAWAPERLPEDRDASYFALRYRVGPDAVVVGSNELPQDGWSTLPTGAVLRVERGSLRCSIS